MKKVFSLMLVTLALVSTPMLSAMSIGREGNSFLKNDILWQPVRYEDNDAGFKAAIPGSPRSGLSNDSVFTQSKYQNALYEIHCSLNERYKPPKKEKLFRQEVEEVFAGETTILSIPSNQKKVLYIAEIYFNNESKVVRLYCSKNCLYWAIVKGEDLSLAPLFFDTIEITK